MYGIKKRLFVFVCGVLLASTASADFTKVEMGVGAWMQSPSGNLSYSNAGVTARDNSKEDRKTSGYAWLLIKHPVPVLPNLRIEYTSVENTGIANGSFKDFSATNANTKLEINQFDIIPYYNILDNTAWITLDLGLDIKIIDASYKADNVTVGSVINTSYNDSETIALPLVYVRGRVEIPDTNIGLETDVKYITYSNSTIYDARVKIDYTLDFVPVIQPALEVGYRIQKIDIDEDSFDAVADLEFSGAYVGLMLRF